MTFSDELVNNTSERYIYAKEQYVLNKATKIQIQEARAWSYLDFPEIRYTYFKNIVWSLRKQRKIETHIRSRPSFYRIKGVYLPGRHDLVTNDRRGVRVESLVDRLGSLTYGPLMIHDIRMLTHAYGIHAALVDRGYLCDGASKDIFVKEIRLSKNRTAKVTVHNNDKFTVTITCSLEPLICGESDTFYLFASLGEIKNEIEHIAGVELPPVDLWQLIQCHLNRDANTEFSDKAFNYTIENLASSVLRVYNKRFPEGKRRVRVEKIESPRKKLGDFVLEVIGK